MSTTAATSPASPTPILDRQAPLPKMVGRSRSYLIALGIGYGLAIAFNVTIIFWRPPFLLSIVMPIGRALDRLLPKEWNFATSILFIVQCFVLLFVAIIMHEVGHALIGVLAGFRFNSLRIGRLQFDRPFRISFYRGRGTGAAGWASMMPLKQDHLSLRTIMMLLAGPGANLLSACLVFLLPHAKGSSSLWFIYWSLLLGIGSLLPFRSRAVISDGGRILMFLRNRVRGERWLAMMKLVEELRTGVPYEKLTPAFLAKAVAIEDDSPDTVAAFGLAYGVAFWEGKDDEAAQALETCLRHCSLASPATRQALMSDASVFQARRRKRTDMAAQWVADTPAKGEYPWMRLRGEAAILEVKGDTDGALKKLDEAEEMILATPNQALREISLRGLRRWKSEISQIVTLES